MIQFPANSKTFVDVKWDLIVPKIPDYLSLHQMEMLYDGPLTEDGLVNCSATKFLLCLLKDPTGECLASDETQRSVLEFKTKLVQLCNADPSTLLENEMALDVVDRTILIKVANLNLFYPGTLPVYAFSLMLLCPLLLPKLTHFRISYYQYCSKPELAYKILKNDEIPMEVFWYMIDYYIQDDRWDIATIRHIFETTHVPVHSI
ncbi:hypothetical protein DSO57_1030755 [Entomophthora muscae]|uniref:Uncharacterized protein n=1 Tax=Entomophthora muscae TaxID=34485 RepID=A0ACC2T0V6_9FUNG|nr:hypothetical protein DSO57_1030755 [Entomophthora muscae]